MKRRDFLISSTLAAGGLTLNKSSILKANVLPEAYENTEFKPSMENPEADDLSYRCDSMPEGFFDLLPQEAVRYSKFPVNTKHNAIWDFNWGHDGKMYVALCGELGNALSAILFEYDRETGRLEFCFDTGRETMADPRMIPPSRLHGPIHQITVANGQAYGVSGDPNDLGNLFQYSDKTGLREAGRMMIIPNDEPVFSNTQPVRVAVSPNAERVAISVADKLGCVYVFKSVSC